MVTPDQLGQDPPGRRKRRWPGIMFGIAGGFILLAAGASIGGAAAGNPHPAATVTATATVPGPDTTETVTESPPPPAAGTEIGTWSGTGNQVTPPFDVPGSGNYIVTWTYSGNTDTSFGGNSPDNFSIQNTDDGYGNLPNDIASSGHGSTEITSSTASTARFNVQANGNARWTITVKSAD